jgi:hypothetical protein
MNLGHIRLENQASNRYIHLFQMSLKRAVAFTAEAWLCPNELWAILGWKIKLQTITSIYFSCH